MRQPSPASRRQVDKAFRQLLAALGVPLRGEFKSTPARATRLWLDHLLAGEGVDPVEALGPGVASRVHMPVSVLDVGVHLVCPHHLTIAFGTAHVAYAPAGKVAGFGNLSSLIQVCTARFGLQEDASQLIADSLFTGLGATAAVSLIEAVHPCHNVVHPRSHGARAASWGRAGKAAAARELQALVLAHVKRVPEQP